MSTQIIVRGKAINNALIAAFGRRLNSSDEVITQWSNAAVLEAIKNGNWNWFKALFECKALRLDGGGLNKLGMEVYGYVQAHFPRAVYDKETQVVGWKKFNPDSPLADNFIAVGATESNADLNIVEINGKFYQPHGDFALTFAEYRAFKAQKAESADEDEVKSVSAKAFAKAAQKALEAQKAMRFVGSPDELISAMAAIGELADAIRAQIAASDAKALEEARAVLAKAEQAKEANRARLQVNADSPVSLELSEEEKAQILAKRAELEAASAQNAQEELKRSLKTKRSAGHKAKQARAETALTLEIKEAHELKDAV